MSGFIGCHVFENRPASCIPSGQALEVVFYMSFDLALGFSDEAEAQPIAAEPCYRADRRTTEIPERVENARLAAKFGQPRRAPGKMIDLFVGSPGQLRCSGRIAGDQGLRAIQRLGRNLTGPVDPQQTSAGGALGC